MRKNRLIALIGTLTMAAAGLAAVSAGVSSKKAEGVSAGSGEVWTIIGDVDWATDSDALSYSTVNKFYGTSSNRYEIEHYFNAGSEFKVRKDRAWDVGIGYGGNTNGGIGKYTTNSGGNFKINNAGTYLVTVKDDNVGGYGDKSYGFAIAMPYHVNVYDGSTVIKTSYSEDYENEGYSYTFQSSDFDKAGYDFLGLYEDSTFNTPFTSGSAVAQDQKLYAKYELSATDYTINFNANGGTGSMGPVSTAASASYTLPSASDRSIHKANNHFTYWTDGKGNQYVDGATIPANRYNVGDTVTLTANWNPYTINNGYWIEFFNSPRTPQRVALTHNGQSGDQSLWTVSDVALTDADSFKIVRYEGETIQEYFGTEMAESKSGAAIHDGQFVTGTNNNFDVKVNGNFDFYYHDCSQTNKLWVSTITYSVIYHANNSTSEADVSDTAVIGAGYAFRAASTFSRPTNKKFLEWNTSSDGKGSGYQAGSSLKVETQDPIELYAIWTDNVPSDGVYVDGIFSGSHHRLEMTLGADGKYHVDNQPLAIGDTFKFVKYLNEAATWYGGNTYKTTGDLETAVHAGQLEIDNNDDFKVLVSGSYSGDLDINAEGNKIWIGAITYNVAYHANGVTGDDITNSYNVGTATTAIANPYNVPQHHTFLGWNTDEEGEGVSYSAGQTIAAQAQNSTLDLYAQWEISSALYSVTYNPNGGDGTITTDSIEVGTGFTTKESNLFSFANHQFVEWNTANDESGDSYDPNTAYSSLEDGDALTLYAIWRENVPSDGYYVEINGTTRQALSLKQGSTTEYEGSFTLAVDDQFVIANYLDESRTATWGYQDLQGQDGTARAKGQLVEGTSDAIKAAAPGTYTVAFHTDYGSGRTYVPALADSYTISINGVSQPLVAHEGNEIKTASDVNVEAGDVLAVYNNGLLQTMNPKVVSNNNCKSVEGESTVIVDGTGTIYVDKVNNTIFVGGFDPNTFYMVVTNGSNVHYEKLSKNPSPQSDCDEYLTSGEYSFNKDDVISYINTGSEDGHLVPFDVKDVDEASLNNNFETLGSKIACTESTSSFAYLKLGKNEHHGENTVYFGNLDVLNAVNYAKEFIDTMKSVCAAPEGEDDWNYPWSDDIGTKWGIMADKFGDLVLEDESAAGMLTDATTSSSYKEIAHFAAFYDYVYSKYHSSYPVIDDFADRFVENGAGVDYFSSSNKLISVSDVSTSTWIIASVAIVGIAAVGVFFFYRKRKEN